VSKTPIASAVHSFKIFVSVLMDQILFRSWRYSCEYSRWASASRMLTVQYRQKTHANAEMDFGSAFIIWEM
jgi:hypothetical protein